MGGYFTLSAASTDKLTIRSSWLDGLFHHTWAETQYKDANDFRRKEGGGREREYKEQERKGVRKKESKKK
jgi:hypothetical protein